MEREQRGFNLKYTVPKHLNLKNVVLEILQEKQ